MKNFCHIIPLVRNPKTNENTDSRLFKSLLSVFNNDRNRALDLYLRTKNPLFNQLFNEFIQLDELGEPTLKSIMSLPGIEQLISDDEITKSLEKQVGFTKREVSFSSVRDAMEQAIKFNKENEFNSSFVAVVKSDDGVYIQVERLNEQNALQAKRMAEQYSLNTKLLEILAKHNINVGLLDETEEKLAVNGITDFTTAKQFANGMATLIRISKGELGQQALPEEFSHVAIRAMKGNALVDRLINYIIEKDLSQLVLGDSYKQYSQHFKGDKVKIAEEVAGKMLADSILRNQHTNDTVADNFIKRIWNSVKTFFGKWNVDDIQNAVATANSYADNIAQNIMSNKSFGKVEVENLYSQDKFLQVLNNVNRAAQFLNKAINIEFKRLAMFESRSKNSLFAQSQKQLMYDLHQKIEAHQELQGVYEYILRELRLLDQLNDRFNAYKNSIDFSDKLLAQFLRDAKNYIDSYIIINQKYRETILDDENLMSDPQMQEAKKMIDQCTGLISDLQTDYVKLSHDITYRILYPIYGESIEIAYGKYKGRYTLDEIITQARHDITFTDRWLNSAANTNDFAIKGIDNILKKINMSARNYVMDVKQVIYAAAQKLRNTGINDFTWMYEVDQNGNRTGNYVEKYNYGKFNEDKRMFFEELNRKYGRNPNQFEQKKKRNAEIKAWFNTHTVKTGGLSTGNRQIVPSDEYLNPMYQLIMKDLNKKEFYQLFMSIKHRMDRFLPEKVTQPNRTIKIRKDLMERVMQSNGVGQGTKEIWEHVRDEFIRRSDNIDFGYIPTIQDFNNNEVQELPIFYTRRKEGESEKDISMDAVSTLLAYCDMASRYRGMSEMLDQLEIARDFLKQRDIKDTIDGSIPKKERKKKYGITYESEVVKKNSKINERLDDMYSMQVYQRYVADEGTIGKTKIDKGKTANFVNKITALNVYALNLMSGISNVITGNAMMRIEGFCKQFVTNKEINRADKLYRRELMQFIKEFGNNIKTNKISLFDELFDVMQDYDKNINDVEWQKQGFKKLIEGDTLYFMNNVGEHWMQNRTAIALALHYKMLDNNGNETNLWDALEVKYFQGLTNEGRMQYGDKDVGLGATLHIKEGYKKLDGTEFTEDDRYKFERKCAGMNHRMHGIYNKQEQNAFQMLGIGRMAMMFRKYMKPAWDRRFGYSQYDADLEAVTEGYYITTFRFLKQLKDNLLENHRLLISDSFKSMTPEEQFNIKRSIRETISFVLLLALSKLFDFLNEDDKDEDGNIISQIGYDTKDWQNDGNLLHAFIKTQMLIGQAVFKREVLEVGLMTPFKSPKATLMTPLKLLDQPAAAISTIEGTIGLLDLLLPKNYTEELQSGPYKGHTKAYRSLMKSPLSGPLKQYNRTVHPENLIKWMEVN